MAMVRVGDELAFNEGRSSDFWVIYTVEKITPSGRIRCGHYELNPDLTVRGRGTWSTQPYKADFVTDEIRESIKRRELLYAVTEMVKWGSLTNDQLEQVLKIVKGS